MPTKSLQTILYRELSKAKAKEVLINITPLFRELVNYGSNALIRCATSLRGEIDDNLAALAIYRLILEMIDAFEVLISESCPIPTIPLLRCVFEALLSLDYLFEEKSTYTIRSLSWFACDYHKRIELYKSFLPSTQQGKLLKTSIQKDKGIHVYPNPPEDQVNKAIDNLSNHLLNPKFNSIELEFLNRKKRVEWYSLFGGPRNIQQLSEHLHRNAQYDLLYRYWSNIVHAQELSLLLVKTADNATGIKGIRDSASIVEVSRLAATFMVDATRSFVLHFRPDEDYAQYYNKEIRPLFISLMEQSG